MIILKFVELGKNSFRPFIFVVRTAILNVRMGTENNLNILQFTPSKFSNRFALHGVITNFLIKN